MEIVHIRLECLRLAFREKMEKGILIPLSGDEVLALAQKYASWAETPAAIGATEDAVKY